MFVGYEIKSQQNQAKPVTLETDIKLSQAVLDPSKGGKKEPVCLMVEYQKKQFIIAVLDATRTWQCPLDLMFSAGSEVKFFLKGSGTVHLTGFEYRDDMNSELGFDTSSDEEEEEDLDDDEEDDEEEPKPSKASEKRVSKVNAKNAKTNGVHKADKKDAKKPTGGVPDESDDDEDESDDEDFDSETMMDDDDLLDSDDDDEELDEEDEDED